MKNWLVFACVLGSLSGGVFSMYAPVSVGSKGLKSTATSLRNISKVLRTYYNSLNSARNKVMPSIASLQLYANTTYMALNNTYGASQWQTLSMVPSMQFVQQFTYGDHLVDSNVGYDLSQLTSQLQKAIDRIMAGYNSLVVLPSHPEPNIDVCIAELDGVFSSIPNELTKFGQCLQIQIDTVPTLVAPLKAIFAMVLEDLKSLDKQLKMCAATSTNCINEYFNNIYSELSSINMELLMAHSLLNYHQQDAMQRNSLCGELIRSNIDDVYLKHHGQLSQCMYLQSSMG